MGIIAFQGRIEQSDDFDTFESFAEKHGTTVTMIQAWSFERLPYGKIYFTWANGAVGTFVGADYRELLDYVRSVEGWPEPQEYGGAIPLQLGMYFIPRGEETNNEQQEVESHADRRVVRQRGGDQGSKRQRRSRAEVQV